MLNAASPPRLAIVGNPVTHSRSPQIHARFGAAAGHAVDYTRIESPLDQFVATVL
ncbi:MAG: shikimate dehydrogenase, partial [Caulobacter sp.]|nr:shikimate dehydrogenase [Vitreoscilla sp.]